jgi:hypothetical protein
VVAVGVTSVVPDEVTLPMLVPMLALIETEVAPETSQAKTAVSPEAMLVALAVKLFITGTAAVTTLTSACLVTEPKPLVAVRV